MQADGENQEATFPARAMLPSGQEIRLRLLAAADAGRLGAYLCGLSEQTRARYKPHPFTQEMANEICATLDPSDTLRLVATVPQEDGERIIAYLLLKMGVLDGDRQRYETLALPLDPQTDGTLAPSVADDYQDQGVGSVMMPYLLAAARRSGRRRVVLWAGVQATNDRAVHFYTKWGFRKIGEFWTDKNNYDMILDLDADR